jgi:hypothetical protein
MLRTVSPRDPLVNVAKFYRYLLGHFVNVLDESTGRPNSSMMRVNKTLRVTMLSPSSQDDLFCRVLPPPVQTHVPAFSQHATAPPHAAIN